MLISHLPSGGSLRDNKQKTLIWLAYEAKSRAEIQSAAITTWV